MKMKIKEKKDYLISEIAGSKAIFTKRHRFNFSRFLEMNDETIESFLELEKLFQKEKEDINSLYVPNAEHTNIVVNLDTCTYYKMVQYNKLVLKMPKPLCDGIITKDKSKSLIVFPGDCIVVAGIDKESETRFIFHAGWRGVSQNIVKNIAIELKKLGVKLEEIQLVIFPSISSKYFKLDLKNSEVFSDYEAFVKYNVVEENNNIDLVAILKSQLTDEGFCENNISEMSYCTYSAYDNELQEYKFNSYRRDKSIQRNAAILLGEKK
jgi:hypothetical protein